MEVTYIELTLRHNLSVALETAARDRNKRPVDLLADIIETVLTDNLIDAVLDI
jgi:hypothetical protein